MKSSSSNKKAIVLGGGLCGKTSAYFLMDTHDVTIFDLGMDNGLLKSKLYEDANGNCISIDYCAPHLFNSRDEEVSAFVFKFCPPGIWKHSKRNAKIFIDNKIIGYPFEYNLWELGTEFANQCISELGDGGPTTNLKDFFLSRFGKTMCEKYHFPYSEKVWQFPLDLITTGWMQPNKIPINTKEQLLLINSQKGQQEQRMTHSEFYYPKWGGIETLVDCIPAPQPIKVQKFFKIIREDNKLWVWNGSKLYSADVVISTIPIEYLCLYTDTQPDLCPPYHGTDIIVARSDFFHKNPDITWIYFPGEEHFFHRMANVGLLQGNDTDLITIEAPGGSYAGQRIDIPGYKFEVIDYYNIPRTYPIETGFKPVVDEAVKKFKKDKIYSIGRWGAHNYDSNMDLTIKMAIDCVQEIKNEK